MTTTVEQYDETKIAEAVDAAIARDGAFVGFCRSMTVFFEQIAGPMQALLAKRGRQLGKIECCYDTNLEAFEFMIILLPADMGPEIVKVTAPSSSTIN